MRILPGQGRSYMTSLGSPELTMRKAESAQARSVLSKVAQYVRGATQLGCRGFRLAAFRSSRHLCWILAWRQRTTGQRNRNSELCPELCTRVDYAFATSLRF